MLFGAAAGRDGLGTAIAATGATNRLAEVINRTESYYHNEENCTGNTDSHGSRHTFQLPTPSLQSLQQPSFPLSPPILMWSIFPTTTQPWFTGTGPILRIRRFICHHQPENRFLTALCADSAIAWALLPRTHYSAASTGMTTLMTIIMTMIIITTMAVIVTVMAGNTTATTSISTSAISTVSPVSILLIRIWHGGTIQTTVSVPYHDQDMAKRFHQTDVNGGMSATQLPAPTRDSQRQAAASQFQQRTLAAPVITRDTQRQAAAQRFNEAEHYGSYDDFRDFSRRQPLTQQQKDAARQRYQSASPEQRQQFTRKCRLTRRTSSEERQRVSAFSPPRLSSARCLRKKYSSAH